MPSSYMLFPWLPVYEFEHLILFLVGLWAMLDKESLEAVISVSGTTQLCADTACGNAHTFVIHFQYIVVLAFTILLDIIQLGLYFPEFQDANGDGRSKSIGPCEV